MTISRLDKEYFDMLADLTQSQKLGEGSNEELAAGIEDDEQFCKIVTLVILHPIVLWIHATTFKQNLLLLMVLVQNN
jgi:hypothetical protein